MRRRRSDSSFPPSTDSRAVAQNQSPSPPQEKRREAKGRSDLNRINLHHQQPMAPPPTPPASASAKTNKATTKKKVTPVQVAFLVERYHADNGFHAALAAFRSDAAHLFKPHHHKPAPKGLLPLADILHDYIALKESRVAIDSAMHAMHSLVSTYYASHPPPPQQPMLLQPPPPGSQPASPPLVPPLFVASYSSSPPQGTLSHLN
jgi:hypothetical protein